MGEHRPRGRSEIATPFKSILCGVEGNPSSTEAARQAIALAAAGSELHFITVHTSFEPGPENHKETLQASLDEAAELARQSGVSATTEMREGRYAVDVLLPESRRHDLLVLGTHGNTRASGLMFGSTASESAHQTEGPLLIAREPQGGAEFPKSILFATDGSAGSWAPARTAAALAAAFDAEISIVHVSDGKYAEVKPVVEAQSVEIGEAIGREPSFKQPVGSATQGIVDGAREAGSSLIVCGRRGLSGIKSLGSVSERVVHHADCSVLLVPAGEG